MKYSVLIIIVIALSYSPARSQTITADRVQEIEANAIPYLKSLLRDNYDANIGFHENLLKIPLLFSGQAADSVLDEIVLQLPTESGWADTIKQSLTYNNQMLIRDATTSVWNGTTWENILRFSWEYNAADDITEELFERWFFGTRFVISINRVTYDDSGNQIEQLIQTWNGIAWVNSRRLSFEYIAGLLKIVVSQDWQEVNWINNNQLLYAYTAPDNILQEIITQLWTGALFFNEFLDNYTFDSNGNLIELVHFVNGPSGDEDSPPPPPGEDNGMSKVAHAFFKEERFVWIYEEFGEPYFLSEFRTEKWIAPILDPGFWEDSLRTQWDMNSIGTIVWGVSQISMDGVWTNDFRITEISTGPTGNLQEVLNDIWSVDDWVSVSRSLFSYKFFVSVVDDEITPDKFQLSQNYPNPFNPETTINFDLQRSGHTLLTVYNLKGEEVARLTDGEMTAGPHSYSWNAASAASGVYIYQLKQNGSVATKKMLLLK